MLAHNFKRIKNILRWIFTGQFGRLFRAILDQFLIKSVPVRRFIRRHFPFEKRRRKNMLKKTLLRHYRLTNSYTNGGLNIAVVVREATIHPKSSAFIRLVSPLTHETLRHKVSIKLYDGKTTVVDGSTDICIVQRTAFDKEKTAHTFVSNLRKKGISLVFDNDDAFHNIDTSHPEHSIQLERTKAMNHIALNADQIWLSVPALKSSYSSVKGKIAVVENSLDERIWKKQAYKKPADRRIQMVYMGTATHDADFKMILPALDQVAAQYPDAFTLTVIGAVGDLPDRPWVQRIYQPRYGSIYPNFVAWFLAQGPFDIGLSPLVDSEFNRGKSDIKCLDYLTAGIVPVVSDVLPYQAQELDGFIYRTKNTQKAWATQLGGIVQDPEVFRKHAAKLMPKAQQYVWQKRSSKTAAAQIAKLLEELK